MVNLTTSMTYAPVVLFVYNRPDHTRQTIEALQKNTLAADTDLFIYSDAAKDAAAIEAVSNVRKMLKTVDGFNQVSIIERDKNWGLAASIIDGVTEIVNRYGRVIVLEDDIVTSPYFLDFMNNSLRFYENQKAVWHISGWNYPISTDGLAEAFFWRVMNCWGWATWADRWQHFEKDPQRLVSQWDRKKIKRFNLDGAHNFWGQVTRNATGTLNTWAIFWYASIFEKDGLCLHPSSSLVENIGHDGSGENCGDSSFFATQLQTAPIKKLPEELTINELAESRIKKFYKVSLLPRIIRKLRSYL